MMSSQPRHAESVESRLSQLERENRRLRLLGAAVLSIVAAFVCVSARRDDVGEVKATRFTLVDANGEESACWGTSKPDEPGGLGEAYLSFLSSPHRQLRVSLSGGQNPCLLMNGGGDLQKDGRLGHIKLGADSKFGPHLFLWGQNDDKFANEETAVRQTHLTTPWGESPDCLNVEVADSVTYKAP